MSEKPRAILAAAVGTAFVIAAVGTYWIHSNNAEQQRRATVELERIAAARAKEEFETQRAKAEADAARAKAEAEAARANAEAARANAETARANADAEAARAAASAEAAQRNSDITTDSETVRLPEYARNLPIMGLGDLLIGSEVGMTKGTMEQVNPVNKRPKTHWVLAEPGQYQFSSMFGDSAKVYFEEAGKHANRITMVWVTIDQADPVTGKSVAMRYRDIQTVYFKNLGSVDPESGFQSHCESKNEGGSPTFSCQIFDTRTRAVHFNIDGRYQTEKNVAEVTHIMERRALDVIR